MAFTGAVRITPSSFLQKDPSLPKGHSIFENHPRNTCDLSMDRGISCQQTFVLVFFHGLLSGTWQAFGIFPG